MIEAQNNFEVISPDPKLTIISHEMDNGSQEITNHFISSVKNPDDTLDAFLDFLKKNRLG